LPTANVATPTDSSPGGERQKAGESPPDLGGDHGGRPLDRLPRLLPVVVVASLTALWAATPSIPVKVRGSGLLMAPESRRAFFARGPGQVQDIKVGVGSEVDQGQLLLTLSRVGQAAPGGGAVSADPEVIQAQLRAVDQQMVGLSAQRRAIAVQDEALISRRGELTTTNKPVKQQLRALEELRQDAVIARYSPLWVGAQDLYQRNRADIATIDGQRAQLRAEVAALDSRAAELRSQRAGLEAQELAQDVFSPAAGRILDLSVEPGQAVLPGQRLGSLAIAGDQDRRLAVVLFTSADATQMAPGEDLELDPKLMSRDSYGGSEQRWGTLRGTLLRLSPASVDLEDVAAQVGGKEEAANLMARARQQSFGEGGDLTSQLPDRAGAPVVLGVVRLETAATPSGLAWSRGAGPQRALPPRTPLEVSAEVERRSLLSYLAPFGRWLAGSRP
jgi:multidrug efflux pump subunit AcrA (membrane-fusion protein)